MELATHPASEPVECVSTDVSPAPIDPNWGACLKRIAHELLSPMTTLRLTLQISRGRLMRGDTVELATLDRALAQVDELSARVNRLCISSSRPLPVVETAAPPTLVDVACADVAEDNQECLRRPLSR